MYSKSPMINKQSYNIYNIKKQYIHIQQNKQMYNRSRMSRGNPRDYQMPTHPLSELEVSLDFGQENMKRKEKKKKKTETTHLPA